MAALDFSAFEPGLKTGYIDGINDNSNRTSVLLHKLKPNSEVIGGNFVHVSLLRRGNPGMGARSETGSLPTAGHAYYSKATFPLKTIYGRGKVTGKLARASSARAQDAFAEAVDAELQSLIRDLPNDHNRMLFGDGTGALAYLTGTNALNSTTFTVSTVRYLQVDDVINISAIDGTGTYSATAITISDINPETNLVTASQTITSAFNVYLFRDGSRAQEPYGIQNVTMTNNPNSATIGAYGNITRTGTGSFWQGNRMRNPTAAGTTRPLTVGLMHQAQMKAHTQGAGTIDLIVTDPDMWTTYGRLLAPNQIFNDLIKTMDGGFKFLDFVDTPVTFDRQCIPNAMFFIEMDSLILAEYDEGYQWLDLDGSIMRYIQDLDQVEFTLAKDTQLCCRACNRNVWLDDLKVNQA